MCRARGNRKPRVTRMPALVSISCETAVVVGTVAAAPPRRRGTSGGRIVRNRPEVLQELNKQVQQKYPPTSKDLARDPSMHRTDTCNFFTVVYGEIHLMTDTDETV